MRKVLDKKDVKGKYYVDFVSCLYEFEDRFLSVKDREFLLLILQSVSRGQKIEVKRVKAAIDSNKSNKVKEDKSGPFSV